MNNFEKIRIETATIEGMAKLFLSSDWEGKGKTFSEHAAQYFKSEEEAIKAEIKWLQQKNMDEEDDFKINQSMKNSVFLLPCDKVWYIVDQGTMFATIMRKDIRDLTLYEIDKIDIDGRYWSSEEKATENLKKE